MKEIFLTQGKVVLVDDEDFERLKGFKWQLQKGRNTYYAWRNSPMINGERDAPIWMHHEIIGFPPKGFVNDHKNGNGLHNFKNNLRHVTVRQNGQNLIHGTKSSKYPGVCWHKKDKKWQAAIRINGPVKYLGQFDIEKEAFEAYRQAVNELGDEVIKSAKNIVTDA